MVLNTPCEKGNSQTTPRSDGCSGEEHIVKIENHSSMDIRLRSASYLRLSLVIPSQTSVISNIQELLGENYLD